MGGSLTGGRAGCWGGSLPAYGSQLNVRFFSFFFSLPRQGTAAAATFHVAGFWPDDV